MRRCGRRSRRMPPAARRRDENMPNQRKKGKKQVAVWLTDKEQALIERLLAEGAITSKSDLFKEAIIARAKEKGYINQIRHTLIRS